MGGEYQLDNKLKVVGEIAFGKGYKSRDFGTLLIKGDYNVYNKENLRLDAALGYYNRGYEDPNTILNGVLIGCDAAYMINSKSSFKGDFAFLVGGERDNAYDFISIVNLKYIYFVKSNIGITGGYRFINTIYDNDSPSTQFIHSGLSIGAVYKF